MPIQSLNPATGQLLQTFSSLNESEIERRMALAVEAFALHRRTSFADRSRRLMQAASILDEEKDRFGTIMTREMGKPIASAVAEAEKCATVCRYYAEHAEKFLADEDVRTEAARSYIRYEPLGPVLAVMPWNFPFWQVFRFAAPAIMAGNVGLLKHSSNVPQCALAIEEIFLRAGFEEGVFQTLLIGSEGVQRVLEDPRIRAATLTGSEPAGKSVAATAGKHIKKTVLELGGSDPFIVTPSADLETAVETAVKARVINNGQSCIAAKRFIVFDEIAEEFQDRFVAAMNSLRVGDPMDPSVDIGPLATESITDDLEKQVDDSVRLGARILTGGKRLREAGTNFFEPTVLVDIPDDAPAWGEELFGPVASLFRVSDLDEAIALANSTTFGLGASAWTNDEDERRRLIEEIEAGQVFINAMVASDPRLPFGGVKNSGYGRELGEFGIREFVNVKTIYIAAERSERGSDTE
ncbi:MAG: NAD-dependent succinate-semialdehyde dehydrogenase [Acidobacteriota bacterium]